MNNLLLALAMITTAGAFCAQQHWRAAGFATANQILGDKLGDARASLQEVELAIANARRQHGEQRAALAATDQELARARAAEQERVPPLDPAGEGKWPAAKPYFYLPKAMLGRIGYTLFTDDHRLNPPGELLFGMNATERSRVNEASQALMEETGALLPAVAARIEPVPGRNTQDHREISFKLPPLAEGTATAKAAFEATITEALGPARAQIFLERAREALAEMDGHAGQRAKVVTFFADRQLDGQISHHLRVADPGDDSSREYGIEFPLTNDSPIRRFRHLFGEAPLLPLPPLGRE